ncbi:hypothetical protein N7494_005352 [Penicillium frequentans]|uniref:ABC multidrug transporter MDR2 n=1 Tax=Penicillium frequentans TaxID=3151616 RepID=A0AAD6CY01_9EURO|nr:hypothetical protein N7494_005352 [Penicillium glabrum]
MNSRDFLLLVTLATCVSSFLEVAIGGCWLGSFSTPLMPILCAVALLYRPALRCSLASICITTISVEYAANLLHRKLYVITALIIRLLPLMLWMCLKASYLVMTHLKRRCTGLPYLHTAGPEDSSLDSVKQFSVLLPFLIPRANRRLQIWMTIRLLCIVASNVMEVLAPHGIGIFLDESSNHARESGLITWTGLYFLAKRGVHVFDRLSDGIVATFWVGQMRKAAFSHTLSLSLDFHAQNDVTEIKAIVAKAESLNGLLNILIVEFFRILLSLIIACFTLHAKFGPFICFLAVFGSLFCMVADVYLFRGNSNESESKRHRASTALERAMIQALENIVTVELYNRRRYHNDVYGDANDSHLESESRWAQAAIYRSTALETMQAAILFALSMILTKCGTSRGDIVFITLYWREVTRHLSRLPSHYGKLQIKFAETKRLVAHFNLRPTITDSMGATEISDIHGQLSFSQVSFSYPGQEVDPGQEVVALKDVSLSIQPRTIVALVGPSGCGKSTVLQLMLRFYDIDSGSITIDSHDIKAFLLESLRETITMVSAGHRLFQHWSIRQNLKYADFDISDDEMFEACRSAKIDDEIQNLPGQYESLIGNLSEGQKQRIAIAKALIRKPRILVLDEPTSYLDAENEAGIFEMLRNLNRTVIMSANRLSAVNKVDQIIVLQKGRTTESGKHTELMEITGGAYRRLYDEWSK